MYEIGGMRFSDWLFSCVFSDVGAMVLVETGNELTKAGSERRAWRSFDMIALRAEVVQVEMERAGALAP